MQYIEENQMFSSVWGMGSTNARWKNKLQSININIISLADSEISDDNVKKNVNIKHCIIYIKLNINEQKMQQQW